MIAFDGVRKRYGRREVFRGLDARVAAGRITALVGPNGAGKTTLLKLVMGLARADAGRIRVGAHVLDGTPRYRADIGYMPQIAHFPEQLAGSELLEVMRALRGDDREPDLALAASFDLGDAFDRRLGTLSGGTRQKVNAVLALAFAPNLLILDEPTAGLDPLASRILKERLRHERSRGHTILITSHVLAELEDLADDVLFLCEGSVRWSGGADALRASVREPTLEGAVAELMRRPAAAFR